MFRELRRKKNEISVDLAKRLLETERRAVQLFEIEVEHISGKQIQER